ncbi:MAG: MaoC/PaaZ C-terminal domain-containing protein [Prolixibacteraceae bacterium]|jgi:3-hydroxybutyryl-CoA dehydratase|nr:MaoC/PaaZ C-terminal domain-containing protein [Prolixibacteraceae bacterium]
MKEGDKFTQTFLVSNKVYEGFIDLFKDQNPLHTQEQYSIVKGFEGRVIHGNILNGFLSYFIGECLPQKNVIIHTQEIEFKKPVYLNDDLVLTAEITRIFESVKAIEFKYKFINSASNVVAKGNFQIGILK